MMTDPLFINDPRVPFSAVPSFVLTPGFPEVRGDRWGAGSRHAAEAIVVVSDRLRMPNESAPLYTY